MVADGEITSLLRRARQSDPRALDDLIPLVYQELRHIAQGQRRRWAGDPEQGTTTLIHLAYERLSRQDALALEDREHFFAVCAKIIRRIMINAAEARHAQKRGAGVAHVPFRELEGVLLDHYDEDRLATLLDLEEALVELEQTHEELVSLVERHIHAGYTLEEIATLDGVSHATIKRRWRRARAFLGAALQ